MSLENLTSAFDELQLTYDSQRSEPVKINERILSEMLSFAPKTNWSAIDHTKTYTLVTLEEYSDEYISVNSCFDATMRKGYTVDVIKRIENPFLFAQFNLKKFYKQKIYGHCLLERQLFHGTKESNIEAICRENFDWRLTGTCVGHKFGKGISFSPESTYSCHYPKNYPSRQRVMFVADVLEGSSCIGNQLMRIPPGLCDTSKKPDGKVVVKYYDNDFYPKYVIYYSL